MKTKLSICVLALAAILALRQDSSVQGQSPPPAFEGEKTTWHDGFDRYDFLMDEESLAIKPFKRDDDERYGVKAAAKGQRRCIVVVPKEAAAGNPWSWRGCYWDHEPQAEVELLKRGFHIAFAAPDAGSARQSVGHVVQVPDGEAWASEEGRLHRDEQRRGE